MENLTVIGWAFAHPYLSFFLVVGSIASIERIINLFKSEKGKEDGRK